MVGFLRKLRRYLTEPLIPNLLLQITADRITAFRTKGGEEKGKRYFIHPLAAGTIEPSAERSNIHRPEDLLNLLRMGIKQLGGEEGEASLLLPESCFRVFVLASETIPPSPQEQAALVRWRVKKLLPVIPDDFRLDFQVFRRDSSLRILVVGARASIVQEYENLLARAGCRVRAVGVPSIHLLPLVGRPDFLLANLEKDSLALLAVADGLPLLYRFKVFREEGEGKEKFSLQCLAEIENTLHFIEDREKRLLQALYLRWGIENEAADYLISRLQSFGLEVFRFEALPFPDISKGDGEILAPLLGQSGRRDG